MGWNGYGGPGWKAPRRGGGRREWPPGPSKALAYLKAEGETSRFLQVLEQYRRAPAVTREHLYLETMESVLVHSSKVLIDLPSGNRPTSLLLDKLTATRGANARPPFPGSAE